MNLLNFGSTLRYTHIFGRKERERERRRILMSERGGEEKDHHFFLSLSWK